MADTSVQGQAERWVVEEVLPGIYGRPFSKGVLALSWGGCFEFDAVSADVKIVVCVSTSCCRTATGRPAIGKYHKIRSDAFYLLAARNVERRVLVFTDGDMFDHFSKDQDRGRFPGPETVELRHAELPIELARRLRRAAGIASREVSPSPGS